MLLNEGGNVVPGAVEMRKMDFPLVMANLKSICLKVLIFILLVQQDTKK